jgi:cell division protein FtsQ
MVRVISMSYKDIQKRIKRRRIRFRIFLSLLLISAIAIYIFRNPVFKVKNIITKGNNIIPAERLIELSDIKVGDNLLRLNIKRINTGIRTNSYIEESKIKRTLTGNIYIIVNEREAAGISNFGDKFVTMDKKGVIIEVLDSREGVNLPLIEGLDIINAIPGNMAEIPDPRKLNTLEIIFDNVTKDNLSGIINGVELKNLVSIMIKTNHNINFKIGDIENIRDKIERCRVIMEQDLIGKGSKGTIDVSFKGNPVFIPDQQ